MRCLVQPWDAPSTAAVLSRKQRIAFYCQVCSSFSFFSLLMRAFLHSCQGGENMSHFSAEERACSCESGLYLSAVPSVQLWTGV